MNARSPAVRPLAMMRLGLAGAWTAATLALAILAVPSPASALTDLTWSGGGADHNWSTGANWGGTAPSGSVGTLTFPSSPGVCCPATTDDIAGLTASTLVLHGQGEGIV